MTRVILVDFENIQKLDFENIDTTNTEILIFVGRSQSKIPFQLVEKAQTFGERLRWLKIAGDGKNNLDFHLAFELGRLCERYKNDVELIILSKDSGYDSLIKYVNELGVHAQESRTLPSWLTAQNNFPHQISPVILLPILRRSIIRNDHARE